MTTAGPVSLDRPTLERLYQQLEGPLYNVVYRWVWDREEARELVQETFVRLWRLRARVALDTVQALAYRVAINLAANRRRWRRLRRLVTLEALRDHAGERPGADQDLEQVQRRAALHAAVDGLPERLRRVIVLCELGEMSYAEVATVLQIPPGTVASRRNAALAQLRQALGTTSAPVARSRHVVR